MNDKEVFDKIIERSPTKHQYIYTRETLRFLESIIPKKGKILDIGCGSGHIQENIKRQWYGIDISPKSINTAKKFMVKAIVGNATEHIPFPSNYFDNVVSFSFLHHIPDDLDKAFSEVRRVLKPKGKFIIIDHNAMDTHTRLMHSGPLKLVPCKNERALYVKDVKDILANNKFRIMTVKGVKVMNADQQSLKLPFIVRAFKVPLLYVCDMLGTKADGNFMIISKK